MVSSQTPTRLSMVISVPAAGAAAASVAVSAGAGASSASCEQADRAAIAAIRTSFFMMCLPLEMGSKLGRAEAQGNQVDLYQLDRQRRAFSATDAQAGNAALEALLLERVDQRDDDPGAAGADRVAERS